MIIEIYRGIRRWNLNIGFNMFYYYFFYIFAYEYCSTICEYISNSDGM